MSFLCSFKSSYRVCRMICLLDKSCSICFLKTGHHVSNQKCQVPAALHLIFSLLTYKSLNGMEA